MRALANARSAALLSCVLVLGSALPSAAASPPAVQADKGMVVSAHSLASEVGVEVLKRGGNAVDAAVAVGYALAVVYPSAGNIGGGGFMTIRLKDGRTSFLDFRERAPQSASKDMYLDAAGNVVPGRSTAGYLAVGVPGSVLGFETALARFGTLTRDDVMAPAIRLAREGFVLDDGDAAVFAGGAKKLGSDPAAARNGLALKGLEPTTRRLALPRG